MDVYLVPGMSMQGRGIPNGLYPVLSYYLNFTFLV